MRSVSALDLTSPFLRTVHVGLMLLLPAILQQSTAFQSDATLGTGLEWLTIGSILVPAVLLIVLVYFGSESYE